MTVGEIILDEPCPTCGGDGRIGLDAWTTKKTKECPHCGGDGLRHIHADQEKEDR